MVNIREQIRNLTTYSMRCWQEDSFTQAVIDPETEMDWFIFLCLFAVICQLSTAEGTGSVQERSSCACICALRKARGSPVIFVNLVLMCSRCRGIRERREGREVRPPQD